MPIDDGAAERRLPHLAPLLVRRETRQLLVLEHLELDETGLDADTPDREPDEHHDRSAFQPGAPGFR